MNSFDPQSQEPSKRIRSQGQNQSHHHHHRGSFISKIMIGTSTSPPSYPLGPFHRNPSFKLHLDQVQDQDQGGLVVSAVTQPSVTVVLEGRSICHRINLHKHESYHTLARALRQMFVDEEADRGLNDDKDLDLSNAIPGYLVAYEDMENDLLLAGDLNWKDFIRVAKRIRILPAKSNSREARSGYHAISR